MKIPRVSPRSILVPVDFSEAGFRACDLARELARVLKARVEALFVYEPPVLAVETMVPNVPLTEEVREGLEEDIRRRAGPGVAVSVVEGFASDKILERAEEEGGADLIVMATHGRAGLMRALMGSVAERVSRRSPVPVLTVRGGWKPVRSILVPVNFTEYSLRGLFAAAEMTRALGARFDVLHVGAPPPFLKTADFDAAVAALGPYFSDKTPLLLRREGEPAAGIVAAGAGYDLIALVAHRKSWVGDTVLGTTAERVIRRSSVPVLSIPDMSREVVGRLLMEAGSDSGAGPLRG